MTSQTNSKVLKLSDPVENLPGVGEYLAKKLHRLSVATVRDLLELIPHRLEDRSQLLPIRSLPIGQSVVISGQIESVHSRRSQRGVLIVQAKIKDQSGSINALWFNQRYLLGQLKVGAELLLYGEKRIAPSLGNPFFVKKIVTRLEVAPIYPTTAGLYQPTIQRLMTAARGSIQQLPDLVPQQLRQRFDLPSHAEAIESCHFGQDNSHLERARKLLAFEELLVLAVQVLKAKKERLEIIGQRVVVQPEHLQKAAAALPFRLTTGQRRAAWEIIQDLARSYPMYRLLYGEVGSGKTAVALMAVAAVCQNDRQVIWLNPTTILVAQQAEVLKKIAQPLGIKIALVTGTLKEDHLSADLIIGTHALLEPKIKFRDLGLIIIDEQHRFGVDQRQQILQRYPTTHLLMMSATPIPRSLAQSIFGHLDITYLLDKPPHQQAIETIIFNDRTRSKVEEQIAGKISHHEPGFVICPLIEVASASLATLFTAERKAITAEAVRLKKRFPQARIGVVHGRIPTEIREKIITQFKTGKIDILLATTVVEVGIDNPLATWILIEEADRFGLAQLHQLRGRVGRGNQPATCYLSETVDTALAKKRLEVLVQSTDGLQIAEADLANRGPGELIGVEQSGLPALKYASLEDKAMIKNAFAAATQILAEGLGKSPHLQREVLKQKNGHDYQRS